MLIIGCFIFIVFQVRKAPRPYGNKNIKWEYHSLYEVTGSQNKRTGNAFTGRTSKSQPVSISDYYRTETKYESGQK